MEKPVEQPESDITAEPYKGPGAFITGVGEGAVAHYGFAIGGMFLVSLATFIFHKPAEKLVENVRRNATVLEQETAGGLIPGTKRLMGKFANSVFGTGVTIENTAARAAVSDLDKGAREALEKTLSIREHGFGQWLLLHTVGLFPSGKRMLQKHVDPRVTTSIAMGGMAGFLGFVFSPIYFMFTGAKHANDGRRQFEQAKDEILTTRAERDALRDKFVQSQVELEEMKAGRIAQAETGLPVAAETSPPAPMNDHATAALSAVEADSPTHPTAPTIGPEHTEGWAQRMAERSGEALQHEAAR